MLQRKSAPYLFHGQTTALCDVCFGLVPAKVIIEGDNVYFQKRCREHGVRKALVSTDADYFRRCLDWVKPGDRPENFQTKIESGCPYDCGLCPDHEQHSCLALLEVNDQCNLTCPVCFASSSPLRDGTRSLGDIERMLDTLMKSEVEPDLLQISGGEPTLHPQILEIIAMAKSRPIRHLMLNTNGLRIARDPDFVAALAAFKPGFEVYLQFDSLRPDVLRQLRGADLTRIRREALQNLEAAGISTTLVAVVKKGLNDDEVGEIIDHALEWSCVRGVTFQPIQDAGRNEGFAPSQRTVLSDIRRAIIAAQNPFSEADVIPLPCNPESIAIGYALRNGKSITPVTRFLPREVVVDAVPNALTFEKYPELREKLFRFFSLESDPTNSVDRLEALLCCLPEVTVPQDLSYENIFRVVVLEFLDQHNFSISRVKRSCVHFLTLDERIIPFDTYNLFYRDAAAGELLEASMRATASQFAGGIK